MKTPTSAATRQPDRSSLWRERLARYAVSGQPVAAFCRSQSISVASFYLWRKRLLVSQDGAVTGEAKSVSAVSPRFIDLGPVADLPISPASMQSATVPSPPARINIELDLGNGVMLRIVHA